MRVPCFAASCLAASAFLLMLAGCSSGPDIVLPSVPKAVEYPDRLPKLEALLPGSYVAEGNAQHTLHIARLPEFRRAFYWEEAEGGAPTRQFVTMAHQPGDSAILEAWAITRPGEFAGAWQSEQRLRDEFSMYYLRHVAPFDVALAYDPADEVFSGAMGIDAMGTPLRPGMPPALMLEIAPEAITIRTGDPAKATRFVRQALPATP